MPARLVAIDEGPDIPLDRRMVVVGRHPACDTRLDSLRVSRHHCCMTLEDGVVGVRDLGSTNGIRINGQRMEFGWLRPGDELSIAHLRYRLEDGWEPDRDRFHTPTPIPPYTPPREPANPWHWVQPSAWGLGPLNQD
jgi:predicted component of type VI protein secretion system